MKNVVLLSLLLLSFSSFAQDKNFYFIQHLSPKGLQMISCEKYIATHYTTVDPLIITSGYVKYFFMNGKLHSTEYYENKTLENRIVYHVNGKKAYQERRTMEEIGSAGMVDGYNVALYVFPLQLVSAWDTLGKKIAKDGNGIVMETDTSCRLICLKTIKKVRVYTTVQVEQGFYPSGNLMYYKTNDYTQIVKNEKGDTLVKQGNGEFISNFSNDSLFAQLTFAYGYISNETQYFYPNGSKQNAIGLPEGNFLYYYDNGNVRLSGQWLKGNKFGEWNWYNRNGVLLERKVYTEFNLFQDRRF